MKIKLGLLLVLLLSFGTILPLFKDGLFPIHDNTQVVRVYEMGKALLDGVFPVRWSMDLGYGYGYPLFNFYAPLPYYFGGLVYLVLGNAVLATKAMYVLGIIISGIFMFLLVNELLGVAPGLVSAILYMYAPYHAVQIYVRGAVGEYWVYGLLPLVIWGIYKVIKTKSSWWTLLTSLFISLLILSHNIISMLFIVLLSILITFSLVVSIFKTKIRETILKIGISVLLGLLLSSFFWLPALLESKHTSVSLIITGGSIYKDHFLYLDQLWDSPWGFAGSAPERADGMSFKLGKIQIILGILGLLTVYFLKFRKRISHTDFIFINFILLLILISLEMTLQTSQIVWDSFKYLLKFVQFPWRFIVFILLGLSFLSGFVFSFKKESLKIIFSICVIFLSIYTNLKYFQPQSFENLKEEDYKNADYINWTVSKISDEYLPSNLVRPENKESINKSLIEKNNNLDYKIIEDKTGRLSFFIDIPFSQQITLQRVFFPGWEVYLNGLKIPTSNNQGLISFFAPQGVFKIVLLLKSTPIQIIGNSLSIITLLGILLFLINKYNKRPI